MSKKVSTTIYRIVPVPQHEIYEYFIPINIADILVGWGPLPRVVKTTDQTGDWSTVGSRRTVHLADGSTASEQVTHYLQDKEFGYTVSQFTNPIHLLARQAKGLWTFEAITPNSTKLSWTYTYEAHNLLTWLLLIPIVKTLWKQYMQKALDTFTKLAISK